MSGARWDRSRMGLANATAGLDVLAASIVLNNCGHVQDPKSGTMPRAGPARAAPLWIVGPLEGGSL